MKKTKKQKMLEFQETLGKRLCSLRVMNDVMQSELSELLGVDRTTYSYYERGKISINIYYLSQLSRFFGIPLDLLATADDRQFLEYFDELVEKRTGYKTDRVNNRVIPPDEKCDDK